MKELLRRTGVAVAVIGTIAIVPVMAHHSFAIFAMDTEVKFSGTVVEFRWANPHVHITMKVDAGQGVDPRVVGTWDIEGGSTTIMGRQGWNKSTYKAGDPITVVAHPLRDGGKGASLFYAIRADGTRLYHDIARPRGD